MTFDSSQVREWVGNPEARDVLNVDAVDKFCEGLIDKHIGPKEYPSLREVQTIVWIKTALRNYVLTKSPRRAIITPREAALGLGTTTKNEDWASKWFSLHHFFDAGAATPPAKQEPIVMDPATLPEFVFEKMKMGIPVYWIVPATTFNGTNVEEVIRYVLFKASCSPFVKESVHQVLEKVKERKKLADRKRRIHETSKDTEAIPSIILQRKGLYAVKLMTRHAYEREGFLMRNCIHTMHSTAATTTELMISIRKLGVKRPLGDLQVRRKNGELFYVSFAGFANKRAPITEEVLHQFAYELRLKNVPTLINVERFGFNGWQDAGLPEQDFTFADRTAHIPYFGASMGTGRTNILHPDAVNFIFDSDTDYVNDMIRGPRTAADNRLDYYSMISRAAGRMMTVSAHRNPNSGSWVSQEIRMLRQRSEHRSRTPSVWEITHEPVPTIMDRAVEWLESPAREAVLRKLRDEVFAEPEEPRPAPYPNYNPQLLLTYTRMS